jgi:hypothetical protein
MNTHEQAGEGMLPPGPSPGAFPAHPASSVRVASASILARMRWFQHSRATLMGEGCRKQPQRPPYPPWQTMTDNHERRGLLAPNYAASAESGGHRGTDGREIRRRRYDPAGDILGVTWHVARKRGTIRMAHSITLTDEQYDRLRSAAEALHATPDHVVADLLAGLPEPKAPLPQDEYDRRWDAFFQLVGSIKHGAPVTSEEIDELIGEEAADSHDSGAADADPS